jgi:hypothetical protein
LHGWLLVEISVDPLVLLPASSQVNSLQIIHITPVCTVMCVACRCVCSAALVHDSRLSVTDYMFVRLNCGVLNLSKVLDTGGKYSNAGATAHIFFDKSSSRDISKSALCIAILSPCIEYNP